MIGRRMFGVETEYAVTGLDEHGAVMNRASLTRRLFDQAEASLVGAPDASRLGRFLGNGSCFYVDAGCHPEVGSPECLNPWDVVRYARAGDRIMARLADELRHRDRQVNQLLVFKGNVDYSGSGSSWGCHESYLHSANADLLRAQLIPHLVSRVIYTGAGGFHSQSPGIEFMLSPRAAHLSEVVSSGSMTRRGIIHTRNESLSRPGLLRQHLLCGESLQSDRAAWLQVGATALVVAMIEAGVPCAEGLALAAPIQALRTIARDVHCRASVDMQDGPALTAAAIQRRYLAQALASLDAPFMPVWARAVCAEWRAMLDRLEQAPHGVERTLDWAIKLRLYEQRARRRGLAWQTLPAWTPVLTALEEVRQRLADGETNEASVTPVPSVNESVVLDSSGPYRECVADMTPHLEAHGLRWTTLDAVLSLRRELFEIDTRFGQVGAEGLFTALDATGSLDHRFAGIDRIAEAVDEPPLEGRASRRGEIIRRAARERRALLCTWDSVVDLDAHQQLDLSDPFEARQEWVACQRPDDGPEFLGLFRHLRRRQANRA